MFLPAVRFSLFRISSIRAGFTPGPCSEKNVGALQLGRQTLFFLEKNWRPFLVITVRVSAVSSPGKLATFFAHHSRFTRGVSHFSGMQKFAAPFVGAPVRPNVINMPKSAAV